MGDAEAPALSVVVPVYNEEGNVGSLFGELVQVASATGRTYEILFVNDGSRDGTFDRLCALAAEDRHLRIVDLDGNFGEAAALCAGFASARGAVIVTLDGDGQNDPADIPQLLAAIDAGADVASGRRLEREEPFLTRVLPSRVANWLIATLSGVPAYDCGCGLKAYRREVVRGAQLPRGMNRFLPAILGVDARRVVEVRTKDRPRGSGASHYGLSRVFIVFRDLLALPLLVQRPLPGPAVVRVLGALTALAAAGCAVLLGVAVRGGHPALGIAAAGSALLAAAAHAVRHNVQRLIHAHARGVFRVRRILDHAQLSAEDRTGRLRVLGQEPAADVPRAPRRPGDAML